MKKKRLGFKHIKTENDKILSKTDIVLQSIRDKLSRDLSTKYLEHDHPFKMMQQLNQDYSQLLQHRQLKNNVYVDMQLYPHSQEFFCINIPHVTFPIYMHLKNISTEGVAYVGYNRQFPGVELQSQQGKEDWDFKYPFNFDKKIKLQNPKRKNVKILYITILPKKKFLTLSLKVTFYEDQQMERDSPTIKIDERKKKFILPSMKRKNIFLEQPEEESYKSKSLYPMKKMNQLSKIAKIENRNFSQKNLKAKTNLLTKEMTTSLFFLKKQNSVLNEERVRENLAHIEEVNQKKIKIKEEASKCKQLIENYKEKFLLQNYQKKKINKYLVPFLLASVFSTKAMNKYNEKVHSIDQAFIIRLHLNTFIKKIRRNYRGNVSLIPSIKTRNKVEVATLMQVQGKFLNENSINQAQKVMCQAFSQLKPCLMMNQAFSKGLYYDESAIKIQNWWRLKYKTRMMMFKNYVKRHVSKMVKQHPYLRELQSQYYNEDLPHKMIYNYMIDETLKFRKIYANYKQTLIEIELFQKKNEQVMKKKTNKKNTKSTRNFKYSHIKEKEKKLLQVVKVPQKPRHRFFRNIDILKAMVRGWFQLEYKKIVRKNSLY